MDQQMTETQAVQSYVSIQNILTILENLSLFKLTPLTTPCFTCEKKVDEVFRYLLINRPCVFGFTLSNI